VLTVARATAPHQGFRQQESGAQRDGTQAEQRDQHKRVLVALPIRHVACRRPFQLAQRPGRVNGACQPEGRDQAQERPDPP